MTTALVLPGGGSLGAVQVGMLRALAENGIEPELLVGTSAGAINATWVASHGMSKSSLTRLGEIWTDLRRADLFPLDPRLVARGLLGRRTAVASTRNLEHLVSSHISIGRIEDTPVPLHLIAADLLSGDSVLLSTGALVTGVLASAAVPGVFPPVEREGRLLVDGAIAQDAGVALAVELGASVVYVLPAGAPCALPRPPRSAVGVALHSLSLLIERRLEREVAAIAGAASVRMVPPLCPLAVSAADFGHAAELIDRGHRTAREWFAAGAVAAPSTA